MKIYLIRHASAEEAGARGDLGRPLSARGREEARRLGEAFRALGLRPGVILSSPAVRARETAEALAAQVGGGVEVDAALAPGAAVDAILAAVKSREGRGDVAVVGHQPDLGATAAFFLGHPPGAALQLRPSGVCGLDPEAPEKDRLVCFYGPDDLARLAGPG